MPNKHISTIYIQRTAGGKQPCTRKDQNDKWTQLVDRFFHTIALREVTIVTKERKRWNIRAERRDKNQLKRIGYKGKNIRKKTRKKNEMSQLPFFKKKKKNVRNECFERSSLVRLAPTLGLSRPTAGSILKRCCCCCCGCASRGKIHQFFFHIFSTAKWE